jgi:hypothetical protein
VKILKSQVKDEAAFRDALEKLRQAKIDHMMSEEVGTSSPSDPFLDQFIKRTPTGPDTPDEFTIDYEIVNDDPSPEELKARAINELRAQEQAEIEKIWPSNKRRLMQFEVNRATQFAAQIPAEMLSEENQKILADWNVLQKRIEEIQYAYAKREADL